MSSGEPMASTRSAGSRWDEVNGDDGVLTLLLEASVHAPRQARHAVRDWLRARGTGEELINDVVLVVSELVTNAVMHAGSVTSFVVTQTEAGAVRVDVGDGDPSPPRPSEARAIGGAGLLLVAQLSTTWGWTPGADGGKVVWAELGPQHPS